MAVGRVGRAVSMKIDLAAFQDAHFERQVKFRFATFLARALAPNIGGAVPFPTQILYVIWTFPVPGTTPFYT